MHCLGAVAGAPSPNGVANRAGILSVLRALGVLVCEGRIQGPPRGYREGPHCAPPMQSAPSEHVCEKDNYLCDRYLVLVQEIADCTTNGSFLCVEVLLCSDCPCGLAKATSKHPVCTVPTSLSIAPWQHASEILLEYWCIGVIQTPGKGSETMNFQGLYQAVRSRLHFSQVAAWWSRSNGSSPSYIATRVVNHNEDNLRGFREPPVEHTFPLAGNGDGNAIKVSVWALPRMEDVPKLVCSMHPIIDENEVDEAVAARALTPTKAIPVPSSGPQNSECLVMPALVDDRLQTPCNKPGKHHCRYEEEDGSPPSPSIARPNSERKRRRSLPCGPADSTPPMNNQSPQQPAVLPSLREFNSDQRTSQSENGVVASPEVVNCRNEADRDIIDDVDIFLEDRTRINKDEKEVRMLNNLNADNVERCFRIQLNIDESNANFEKRYKRAAINSHERLSEENNSDSKKNVENHVEMNDQVNGPKPSSKNGLFESYIPFNASLPWSFVESWNNSSSYNRCTFQNFRGVQRQTRERSKQSVNQASNKGEVRSVDPRERSAPFHESNPGPSTHTVRGKRDVTACAVHRSCLKPIAPRERRNNEIGQSLSELSLPTEKTESKEEGGILGWFSKVPGRVLGVAPEDKSRAKSRDQQLTNTEVKINNCNLELSQREFNEVLAVLRARTPSGRKRAAVRTVRKRDAKPDRNGGSLDEENVKRNPNIDNNNDCPTHYIVNRVKSKVVDNEVSGKKIDCLQNTSNKADVLLGAILRTSREEKKSDCSDGIRPRTGSLLSNTIDEGASSSRATDEDEEDEDEDDEKSLSMGLNKRFNRLRQLFIKDQDKHQRSRVFVQPGIHETRNSRLDLTRAKRRIDFMESQNHVSNAVQSQRIHNAKEEQLRDTARNSDDDLAEEELCSNKHNISDPTKHGFIPISAQNGHVSSKLRNNNGSYDSSTDEDEMQDRAVPSAIEQERFRRSLENAASMVFHSRTGLPLTSSPAPLRRGSCCFDYDSSLNSVSSKRSALFELNTPPSPGAVSLEETDRETENTGEGEETPKRRSSSRNRPQSHALLGSFEESALNGRLEPVSTVHGFTAELGASGSFCPKHRKLPVTVFFYTLGDNDKVSTPYLAHINLEKKGYQVPRSGTIQVTLLNPLGTVVKMFVVLYDLSDMPPRSHTFLRQRTLRDKTLRYLVHLRFASGKTGRIYLHTDIRMIICRKSDVDTASDFGSEPPKELSSYIHGPTNPKFSPRC